MPKAISVVSYNEDDYSILPDIFSLISVVCIQSNCTTNVHTSSKVLVLNYISYIFIECFIYNLYNELTI